LDETAGEAHQSKRICQDAEAVIISDDDSDASYANKLVAHTTFPLPRQPIPTQLKQGTLDDFKWKVLNDEEKAAQAQRGAEDERRIRQILAEEKERKEKEQQRKKRDNARERQRKSRTLKKERKASQPNMQHSSINDALIRQDDLDNTSIGDLADHSRLGTDWRNNRDGSKNGTVIPKHAKRTNWYHPFLWVHIA
jgi:hypothetical protein